MIAEHCWKINDIWLDGEFALEGASGIVDEIRRIRILLTVAEVCWIAILYRHDVTLIHSTSTSTCCFLELNIFRWCQI